MAPRKQKDPAPDQPEEEGAPEEEASVSEEVTSEEAAEENAGEDKAATPEDVEAEPYDASSHPGPTVDTTEGGASGLNRASSVGGMLCHLSILCHFVTPFLSVVVPLVLWLILKDEDPEVDHHGREALNLQICVLLTSLLLGVTCLFAFLIPVLWLTASVFGILAAVEAHAGRRYRYPLIWRPIN
jgi:uncharacterized Tic20 family protein